jgi:hypothetical protein
MNIAPQPSHKSRNQDDLYGFAVELRRLAYTMPAGHEDPLIRLSERMVSRADQGADRVRPTTRRAGAAAGSRTPPDAALPTGRLPTT